MPDKPWNEGRALVTDESRDAVWALRMVEEQLASVEDEPWRWKWVIIATHNALQCAMVLALHDWHGLEILRDDHREEMAAWLNGEREEYPKCDRGKEKVLRFGEVVTIRARAFSLNLLTLPAILTTGHRP